MFLLTLSRVPQLVFVNKHLTLLFQGEQFVLLTLALFPSKEFFLFFCKKKSFSALKSLNIGDGNTNYL